MSGAANFGWDSLRHGGLLLDPQRVRKIAEQTSDALSFHLEMELRRRAGTVLDGSEKIPEFIAFILQEVCGFTAEAGTWLRGAQVGSEWTRRSYLGEAIRPRQIWLGLEGGIFPVFIDTEGQIGLGRGRKAVSHVLQWLRSGQERLAILTNGRQWRLLFAGIDFDAWCEWDVDLWFEGGSLSPQVTALRTLLAPALWMPVEKDQTPPLLQAIYDSRKGQAELSAVLGERVREAVEILIQSHGEILKEECSDIDPAEIYRAAVRVVMRLVVIFFAESRELLPRDNPLYHSGYGVAGLIEELARAASRGGNRLARSCSAWPRLLALFRLIYQGSHHEALPVPAYGGELFAPGDSNSSDTLCRALYILESACFDRELMPDRDVYSLLDRITRTRVKIRQGRSGTWVPMPVDFSDLSSEYIGILYEGLLDYELKVASPGEPIIFLAVGDQPALPLSRLEAMSDRALADLFAKMKDKRADEEGEESESEEESMEDSSDEGSKEGTEVEDGEETEEGDEEEPSTDVDIPGDERQTVRTQAETWARRAVVAGSLIRKPRGSLTPERRAAHEQTIGRMASRIVTRVVLPGEWYLVRWGGTRKGAGTFYTPPGLAVPTVHRTLRPLAYDPPAGPDGKPDSNAPSSAWTPKKPEEILRLKVCDPACGSGTFPVAALRFLTDAVFQSLHNHNRLKGDTGVSLDEILGIADVRSAKENPGASHLPCRPEYDDFEKRTKAVLRRYVVERSIYGVDLDPLAVELCRLSLWVETMDRTLPFSFLDHKIKCGNSLVGAWFDQFRHYPVMAWKNREGGDKNHSNGVHFAKDARTRAIKKFVKDKLTPDLQRFLERYELFPEGFLEGAEAAHDEAQAVLSRLHDLPAHETAERARIYRDEFIGSEAYRSLKSAMDLWCSCWYWPSEELDKAPLPTTFSSISVETKAVSEAVSAKNRFFHWELEFPDVFRGDKSGFDAMLGNPPWEIAKPNSKEFFSNIDPLYRSYGKQEAIRLQKERYFVDIEAEHSWLDYNSDFRAQSNYMGSVFNPSGDSYKTENRQDQFRISRGTENEFFQSRWRETRKKSKGYCDPEHGFRYQGSADLNLYKLFLEQIHSLIKDGGRLGLVVPSGIYSDHGTQGLRRLFLDKCNWEWLFSFENREKIFDIHRSYKFNPVIIEKGGKTGAILTAFMRRKLEDWEKGEEFATPYSRIQVERFSPRSLAILEIQSQRDLEILEKIYANSVLLGDEGPNGWGIKYSTEFHMTNDSKLFPPRPWWEERGYRPDEYSRWLKGNWRPISELWAELGIDPREIRPVDVKLEDWLFDSSAGPEERQAKAKFIHGHLLKPGDVQRTEWRLRCAQPPYDSLPIPRADIPTGIVLSREADAFIHEENIEDVALPLFQGVMIWIGKPYSANCVSIGRGQKDWMPSLNDNTSITPKYLIALKEKIGFPKVVFRDISNSTNERTIVSAVLPGFPCGNVLGTFSSEIPLEGFSSTISSLFADWQIRQRIAGTHLNLFVMNELAVLPPSFADQFLSDICIGKNGIGPQAAPWSVSYKSRKRLSSYNWRGDWALTDSEVIRRQLSIEAITGFLYGLNEIDARYILSECDYLPARGGSKGFWRIDKEKDPELRHTILTCIAFVDLMKRVEENNGDQASGITAFLNENDGEGWLIPETICLTEYGFGHNDRAKQNQLVASRLGPRFYDWQLAQNSEESWRECNLHARNILGEFEYAKMVDDLDGGEGLDKYPLTPERELAKSKKVAEDHGPLYSKNGEK